MRELEKESKNKKFKISEKISIQRQGKYKKTRYAISTPNGQLTMPKDKFKTLLDSSESLEMFEKKVNKLIFIKRMLKEKGKQK